MSYTVTYDKVHLANGLISVRYALKNDVSGAILFDQVEFDGAPYGLNSVGVLTPTTLTSALEHSGLLFKTAVRLDRETYLTKHLQSQPATVSFDQTTVAAYLAATTQGAAKTILQTAAPDVFLTGIGEVSRELGYTPASVTAGANDPKIIEVVATAQGPQTIPLPEPANYKTVRLYVNGLLQSPTSYVSTTSDVSLLTDTNVEVDDLVVIEYLPQ